MWRKLPDFRVEKKAWNPVKSLAVMNFRSCKNHIFLKIHLSWFLILDFLNTMKLPGEGPCIYCAAHEMDRSKHTDGTLHVLKPPFAVDQLENGQTLGGRIHCDR